MARCRTLLAGFVLLWQGMPLAHALAFMDESLSYRAYFQGIFTAEQTVGIADVSWETFSYEGCGIGQPLVETRMTVSSAAYPFVERLYPFRLVYRSLTLADPVRTIAYEKYDSTEGHGRDLTWLDSASGIALRFREGYIPKEPGTWRLPEALETWGSEQQDYHQYKRPVHRVVPGMVDQTSLLQRIRTMPLQVGAQFRVPVTDGKYRYVYQVGVVDREPLVVAGREWQTLKLRFDGFRVEDGRKEHHHDPLWVWLDDSPRRTPLRFEYRNAYGRFAIDLQAIDS
jgi:hypothetical protein